jgi:hypothetical protein
VPAKVQVREPPESSVLDGSFGLSTSSGFDLSTIRLMNRSGIAAPEQSASAVNQKRLSLLHLTPNGVNPSDDMHESAMNVTFGSRLAIDRQQAAAPPRRLMGRTHRSAFSDGRQ